jgi:ABC-2 type transport system ATP-binding protein
MSDSVIQAEGLTRYFGRKKAVDSLSLSVPRGTVYGFLGRNGSGKTTTIRMLLGLLHSTRGRSALLGCDSEALTPEVKARVGYLAEGHPLFTWMCIRDHADFFRPYYSTWDGEWFDEALARFRLDPKRRIRTLSRGERAQVALALCLAPQPELLILDDPATGLDPVVRRDFLESIVEIIQQAGRTIFFSSHIVSDVERVADRIGIIEGGVLRADCTLSAFKENVRRVRCRFREGKRPEVSLPGLLRVKWLDNEATLTVMSFDENRLAQLRELGAEDVEPVEAGLEELFIDYTAPLSGRT